MRVRYFILILIIIVNLKTSATADSRFKQYISNDFDRFTSEVNIKTALMTGGWLAGMYLLSAFDDDLNNDVKSMYTGNWKAYFNTIDYLGYIPYTLPVTIGITGLTMLGNDKKLQDAAFTSAQAQVTSLIFVGAIKLILGRTRPDAGNGPRHFNPFSDFDAAFPSGHTSTAFALVTPWIYYYPNPLTYALLILPASTAVSRIVLDRHWFTDVLTGAVIGTLVGITLAKWHKELAEQKGFYDPLETPPTLIKLSVQL